MPSFWLFHNQYLDIEIKIQIENSIIVLHIEFKFKDFWMMEFKSNVNRQEFFPRASIISKLPEIMNSIDMYSMLHYIDFIRCIIHRLFCTHSQN